MQNVFMLRTKTLFRPRGYKTFSCSIQLSKKFSLLINMKMPIVGIFIFISREIFMARKNMQLLAGQILCSAALSMKKVL